MNLTKTVISTKKPIHQPVFSDRGYNGQIWSARGNEGLEVKGLGIKVV